MQTDEARAVVDSAKNLLKYAFLDGLRRHAMAREIEANLSNEIGARRHPLKRSQLADAFGCAQRMHPQSWRHEYVPA
jgi:hypothetical protein